MDFTGVMFYLFSLLSCFFGLESVLYREFAKTIATISGARQGFWGPTLARLFIIGMLIASILVLAFIQAALNGVYLPIDMNLLILFSAIMVLSTFFFLLGQALGRVKPVGVSVITILIAWVFFIFVMPAIINGITEIKSNRLKPQYELAMLKLEKFSKFEKELIEKEGILKLDKKITDSLRAKIKEYNEKVLQEILSVELSLYREMVRISEGYFKLCQWTPGTFYISVTDELSSTGYLNILDFYLYTIKLKEKFVHFILQKVYFENFSKVKPFLSGDKNVYRAASRVPGSFLNALLIQLSIILLLGVLNYNLAIRERYRLNGVYDDDPEKPRDVHLLNGIYRVFRIKGNMLLNHLYNLFCGRTREISKSPCCPGIFLNDNDLTKTGFKGSFLYLCSPGDIPGDRVVNHVFNLFCDLTHCPKEKKDALSLYLDLEKHGKIKIKQLKNRQKASLLLSLVEMSDRDVYLFHNIVRGLGRSFTEAYYDLVARLTAKGKPVLYLTDNTTLDEDSETEYSYYQDRTEPWVQHVTLYTANDDTAMKYE